VSFTTAVYTPTGDVDLNRHEKAFAAEGKFIATLKVKHTGASE